MPKSHLRLSKPQKALLEEIRAVGVLYIKRYGRYDRTVQALLDRGLVFVKEPDYSRMGQDGYAAVESAPETKRSE